jgi:Apea-like HEPN
MIAAEAVLGDPTSKTELRYKFALRAAFALEPIDAKRRRGIFEDMKRAYDVRSAVVHGTVPKDKDLRIGGQTVTLPVFLRRTEDNIRAIVRGLVLGNTRSDDWDDTIVGKP